MHVLTVRSSQFATSLWNADTFTTGSPLATSIALQCSRTSIARLFSDSDMQINHLCDVSTDCWRTVAYCVECLRQSIADCSAGLRYLGALGYRYNNGPLPPYSLPWFPTTSQLRRITLPPPGKCEVANDRRY